VKLLCTADLHLGRRPSSKVPANLRGDGAALGPTAAWRDFVDLALREDVDAVLLAGDLVDDDSDFYEAFGVLWGGVKRLNDAGIRFVTVAGNHDGEILPRLAHAIPEITILGRNGTWERVTLTDAAGTQVDIVGWSMPATHHDASPFEKAQPFTRERPTIGLLHADLNQANSRYAPVREEELSALGYDAWLLGHIHQPDDLASPPRIGYLGPPVGTDPGEPGPRGPWRITIGADGHVQLEHLHRAPLMWQRATVDVTECGSVDEVTQASLRAVAQLHDHTLDHDEPPRAVGVELVLEGRTMLGSAIRAAMNESSLEPLQIDGGSTTTFVYRMTDNMQTALDLEQRARQQDPVGLLAQRVLTLRAGGEAAQELIRRARPKLEDARSSRYFSPLRGPTQLDDDVVARNLERAALQLIDELLKERESA